MTLSSLDSLHKNSTWRSSNFKIESVHLMGAAVDNEEISKNPRHILNDKTNWGSVKSDYGEVVEEEVVDFYNLYSPEDNILQPNSIPEYEVYPAFEGDSALGQNGSQTMPRNVSLPKNYNQTNVLNEIKNNTDADGDGKCDLEDTISKMCTISKEGDNHMGYMGFRDNAKLMDDGAMGVVVGNWKNATIKNETVLE